MCRRSMLVLTAFVLFAGPSFGQTVPRYGFAGQFKCKHPGQTNGKPPGGITTTTPLNGYTGNGTTMPATGFGPSNGIGTTTPYGKPPGVITTTTPLNGYTGNGTTMPITGFGPTNGTGTTTPYGKPPIYPSNGTGVPSLTPSNGQYPTTLPNGFGNPFTTKPSNGQVGTAPSGLGNPFGTKPTNGQFPATLPNTGTGTLGTTKPSNGQYPTNITPTNGQGTSTPYGKPPVYPGVTPTNGQLPTNSGISNQFPLTTTNGKPFPTTGNGATKPTLLPSNSPSNVPGTAITGNHTVAVGGTFGNTQLILTANVNNGAVSGAGKLTSGSEAYIEYPMTVTAVTQTSATTLRIAGVIASPDGSGSVLYRLYANTATGSISLFTGSNTTPMTTTGTVAMN